MVATEPKGPKSIDENPPEVLDEAASTPLREPSTKKGSPHQESPAPLPQTLDLPANVPTATLHARIDESAKPETSSPKSPRRTKDQSSSPASGGLVLRE